MKRVLSILLLAGLILSQISCGDSGKQSETTAEDSSTDLPADTYPVPEADFGNSEFGILCRTEKLSEVFADTETGDTLSDAVYQRNRNVEERYKVKITAYDVPGSWSERENFYKNFTSSVLAGEDKYDLVAYYEACASVPISEGYMYDLRSIKSLDLENDWWYPGYNDVLTVNGKLYSCLGDIAMTTWEYPVVTFFNKDLMEKYGMEYPYDAVKEGKWTFDMLCKLASEVSGDLDGNGSFDENDLYGWLTGDGAIRCMPMSFDFPLSVTDGGKPKLSVGSQKFFDVYDRVYDIIYNSDWATILKKTDDDGRMKAFTDGHVMFFNWDARNISKLREMDDDFGILPYPKYDEAQEDYSTVVFDNHSVFCVPKTAKDPERSGLILDAMGYESMKLVTPAYYDILLGGKVARDEESREMLDIIRGSFRFDFATVNSLIIDGIFPFFGNYIVNGVESVASEVASKLPVWEEKFDSVLAFYLD